MITDTLPPMRVLLFLGLLAAPLPGFARDQALDLGLAASFVCAADARRYHGAALHADLIYQISDLFAVRALAAHGEHRGKGESFGVTRLGVGLRFNLDVFEYVPWIEATPTFYLADGPTPADGAFGVAVGFGFDRLISPTWSVGLGGALHQIRGQDRFPAYLDAGVRVGWRWALEDPFAP